MISWHYKQKYSEPKSYQYLTFLSVSAPHHVDEKNSEKPPPGYPGLETMLPLLLTEVHNGRLTIEDIILRLHTNPRRIFGLPEQHGGFIAVFGLSLFHRVFYIQRFWRALSR